MATYKDLKVRGFADFESNSSNGWTELQDDFVSEYPTEDRDSLCGIEINIFNATPQSNSFSNQWIVSINGEKIKLPARIQFQDLLDVTLELTKK